MKRKNQIRMDRIIHLTTKNRWKEIRTSGLLKPCSDPWFDWNGYDGSLLNITRGRDYLVGIPPDKISAWKRYGQYELLKKYVRDEGKGMSLSKETLVILEVPVLDERGFVREYLYRTPRHMNSKSRDLFSRFEDAIVSRGMNDLNREEWNTVMSLIRTSMASAIPLKEYVGQFKVPEVWLSQKTPVSLIREIKTTNN